MDNPGKILNRARLSRRFRMAAQAPVEQAKGERGTEVQPVHYSSHANYSALMRSHDRMRTRHIAGQSGENGA